jgi:hypothetical protein
MAIPTSACASAGASLTPSPTIATNLPSCCSRGVIARDHRHLDPHLRQSLDGWASGRLDRVGDREDHQRLALGQELVDEPLNRREIDPYP